MLPEPTTSVTDLERIAVHLHAFEITFHDEMTGGLRSFHARRIAAELGIVLPPPTDAGTPSYLRTIFSATDAMKD